jgi:hypothetical protein
MLEVGNPGLTMTESRAHFSLWAILAAPLLAGNDLRTMGDTVRLILTNEEVIAINQDPAGIQGRKLRDDGKQEVWGRPLRGGDRAVVLLNRADTATTIQADVSALGLRGAKYVAR